MRKHIKVGELRGVLTTASCDSILQIIDVQCDHLPALNEVDGRGDSMCYQPQAGPVIGGQNNQGQTSTGEVLLIADVLVASHQDPEARLFRRVQQLAIFQSLPAQLVRTRYLMSL